MSAWEGVAAGLGQLAGNMQQYSVPAVEGKDEYKYTSKLMKLQNEYNEKAYEKSLEGNKWAAENANTWLRTSLRNAGYSTSDPNGTGVQGASVSAMQPPSGNPFHISAYGSLGSNLQQSALVGAQLRNMEANTDAVKAETKNKLTLNEQMQLELEKFRETLPEQIESIKSQYYNLTKSNRKIDAEVDNLAEVTRGLNLDNNFKEATFDKNKEKLIQEVESLVKDNKIKEVSEKLAEYGIVLGASDIGTILSIAASNKGREAATMFGHFIGTVAGSIPHALGEMLKALWHAAID